MGLGTSPAGAFPAGYGYPTQAAEPSQSNRYTRAIDVATGDYSIDTATGGFARTTPTRQRVLLALATVAGSSTVQPLWGVGRPPKMGPQFESEVEASVRLALKPMVDDGSVTILSVTVERGASSRARATVRWRDTSGNTYTEAV